MNSEYNQPLDDRVRVVARLDIKGPNLIKGVHLEGLRVVGKPNDAAKKYYAQGVDEIIYMDTVASLYGRNHLGDIVAETARDIFIPITVGGGIRSLDDTIEILRQGADRVAVNTAAVANPDLITTISRRFGAQCMVLSIEASRNTNGNGWRCYTDNGREPTSLDVVEWAQRGAELGAGEILLTSVNNEGVRKGFDLELVKAVTDVVSIPVIASGGFGEISHFEEAVKTGGANAVAIADAFHYDRCTAAEIRTAARASGIRVRNVATIPSPQTET